MHGGLDGVDLNLSAAALFIPVVSGLVFSENGKHR